MESSLSFLFAAALVTWLGVFLYLFVLGGRVSALRREVERLKDPRSADEESR